MANTNDQALYRRYVGQNFSNLDEIPEELRAYLIRQGGGSEGEYGGGNFTLDLATLKDKDGRPIFLVNDDGSIHEDHDFNDPENTGRRWDPNWGWVTDAGNVNDNRFKERMRRHGRNALMFIGGMGALGAAGALGAGAGGGAAAGEAAGGLAANIPSDLVAGVDFAVPTAGSVPLVDMPAIVGAGEVGGTAGGLAGLGQAAGGGAANIPANLVQGVDYGAAGGAGTSLVDMPAIQQAGGSSGIGRVVDALGGTGNIVRGLAGLGMVAGGSSGGSGSTDVGDIINQMANVNRVDHNTPIGSRRWTQGADGRWSVDDTMSPEEEANFRNVQGLNQGVTQFARDQLAALLARGPRQRYDRPLGE